jgi:amidase
MSSDEPRRHLDATAQAQLVASRQASAAELVSEAIAHAEFVNPKINAIIHPRYERAMEEAHAGVSGPFAGVPMVVKDLNCAMAGEPHHMGARFLKAHNYIAQRDSYLAQKFRAAGFIPIGRTNTPEFGSTITTEPLAYGPTRNPWNLEHSTGGSSGGSAACVAAHVVPVGHANDGGGSIRIPASECALVGLKPSRGRVSNGPDAAEAWMGLSIEGVVTRSVRDAAAVLDCIAGYQPGDPYTAPSFTRPLRDEVGAHVESLRIGVLDHPLFEYQIDHSENRAAIASVARELERLGHRVEEAWPATLSESAYTDNFVKMIATYTHADIAHFERELGRTITDDELEFDNAFLRSMASSITAEQYVASRKHLQDWARRTVQWWTPDDDTEGFDVLLCPTLAGPPPKIGELSGSGGGKLLRGLLAFTSQFNVSGQPAISLPLHWSSDGLPMGVQCVSAPFREDVLVRLASQLEEALPWNTRMAPLVHNS